MSSLGQRIATFGSQNLKINCIFCPIESQIIEFKFFFKYVLILFPTSQMPSLNPWSGILQNFLDPPPTDQVLSLSSTEIRGLSTCKYKSVQSYSDYDLSYSLNLVVSLIWPQCFGSTKSQVRILWPRLLKTKSSKRVFQLAFFWEICPLIKLMNSGQIYWESIFY